jgi:polyprenyl-phospho-N-acetylgalactosaminyl synthase
VDIRSEASQVAKLWIIVPAFNEASSIAEVVRSIREMGYANVCVVDDGSSDETARVALASGACVLRHITNLGQGAALQTGLTYALQRGAEYLCTFDADGQHSAESIGEMYAALIQGKADVALGSRFLGAAAQGMPASKRLVLKVGLLFTRAHARLAVTDTHNGLRIFTRQAALRIRIEQSGMAHASEILRKIGTAGLRFVEVPTTICYTQYSRRKGQSIFESVKILLELLYQSIATR